MRGKWRGSALAALILSLALSVPSQARADQRAQGCEYDLGGYPGAFTMLCASPA
jgi:hypothetical protein